MPTTEGKNGIQLLVKYNTLCAVHSKGEMGGQVFTTLSIELGGEYKKNRKTLFTLYANPWYTSHSESRALPKLQRTRLVYIMRNGSPPAGDSAVCGTISACTNCRYSFDLEETVMDSGKLILVVAVLALPVLIVLLLIAPEMLGIVVAVGAALLFHKGKSGRFAVIEWIENALNKLEGQSSPAAGGKDPHRDFHARREAPRRHPVSNDPNRVSATVDSQSYSYESTDQYCGSTGIDPWLLRREKNPWELPPENNPWER